MPYMYAFKLGRLAELDIRSFVKIFVVAFISGLFIFITQDRLTFSMLASSAESPASLTNPRIIRVAGLAEILQYYNNSNTIFIDARPVKYFNYGSIKNSVNEFPLTQNSETESFLGKLNGKSMIVVYGSEENSTEPRAAALALMDKGFQNVKVYQGGWAEWRSCRLPMTMSEQMKSDIKTQDQE